jgi:ATP-dependent Clp protease adaptor protein ClpS
MKSMGNTKFKESEDVITELEHNCVLIMWNDDYNTFDWVINTLIEICGHHEEQAEQCALIIHSRGKYAVKHGDFDTLKIMAESINERGINATVETLA